MSPYIFASEGQSPCELAFLEAGTALGIPVETNQSAYSADILISFPNEGSIMSEVTYSYDQGKPCLQLPVFGDADVPGLVEEIIKFVLEHKAKRIFAISRRIGCPLKISEDIIMRLFVRTFSHPNLSISKLENEEFTPQIITPKRQSRCRRAWKPIRKMKPNQQKNGETPQQPQEKSLKLELKSDKTIEQSPASTKSTVCRGFFGQDPRKFIKNRQSGNACGVPPPPPPPSKPNNSIQRATRRSRHPTRRIPPRR